MNTKKNNETMRIHTPQGFLGCLLEAAGGRGLGLIQTGYGLIQTGNGLIQTGYGLIRGRWRRGLIQTGYVEGRVQNGPEEEEGEDEDEEELPPPHPRAVGLLFASLSP